MTSPGIVDDTFLIHDRLEKELASIIRVRNRTAETLDIKLPTVLSGLLPRILHHLDIHVKEVVASSKIILPDTAVGCSIILRNDSCNKLRRTIISQINEIVSHVCDRVAANPEMDATCWFEKLAIEICKMDASNSKHLILSLLELAIPRVESKSCTSGQLISSIMSFVDNQYNKIRISEQAQDVTTISDVARLSKGSWILFDIISKSAGMKVVSDWQMDLGDFGMSWDEIDTRLPTPDIIVITALQKDGAAILDLILDLFLFWPTKQQRDNEYETGISDNGRIRMYHRCQGKLEWNELYLRQLKYIMMRYTIWPPSGNGLFVNKDRSILLAIITISEDSMHGRLAAHYLNHIKASVSVTRKRSSSTKNQWMIEKSTCSTSLVVSLLVLMIGDDESSEILQKYPESSELWESVIGYRPNRNSGSSRPPLPHSFACRAIDYINEHYHPDSRNNNYDDLNLYIDLIVTLQKTRRNGVCIGLSLMDNLYRKLKDDQDNDQMTECNLMKNISLKCMETAILVLSSLPDHVEYGTMAFTDNDNNALLDPMQRPAGVPTPFDRRKDLNKLLADHRVSQKRRHFHQAGAVNARQTAYRIISDLVNNPYVIEENDNVLNFEIPLVLFKCASIEEDGMMQYVLETFEKVIHVYRELISKWVSSTGGRVDEQVVSFLPYLLDSVSRDSTTTRLMAARWSRHLLVMLDPLAAFHICSYLESDPDPLVAEEAKRFVNPNREIFTNDSKTITVPMPQFMDRTNPMDIVSMATNLQREVESRSTNYGIPVDLALLLWHDNNFQNINTIDRLNNTSHQDGELLTENACRENEFCGVCYEDVGRDGYSLSCKHTFCQDCWVDYVTCAFDDQSILTLSCPQHDCIVRVTSDFLTSIRPDFLTKWQNVFLSSYLEKSPSYRHCPGPSCPVVVYFPTAPQKIPLSCVQCSTSFCFGCGESPHQPARCTSFNEWNQIFGSSTYWVQKNSKPCPSCQVPIEKSEGCNHMTCSRCSANFCWLCLGTLVRHNESHTCNRYDPASAASDESERQALFFTDRFQAHENAEAFSKRNLKYLQDEFEKVSNKLWFLDESEREQLIGSVKALIEARQFLKFSYVEVWSMRTNYGKKDLFSSYQASLELMTERLSRMTESLEGLEKIYLVDGDRGIYMHFRSMTFVASTVQKFQHRILNIDEIG